MKEDDFVLIIQGSGLNQDRIEESILAMKHTENCKLLIVGDGDILPKAKELVQTNHLSSSVIFIPEDLIKNL